MVEVVVDAGGQVECVGDGFVHGWTVGEEGGVDCDVGAVVGAPVCHDVVVVAAMTHLSGCADLVAMD